MDRRVSTLEIAITIYKVAAKLNSILIGTIRFEVAVHSYQMRTIEILVYERRGVLKGLIRFMQKVVVHFRLI